MRASDWWNNKNWNIHVRHFLPEEHCPRSAGSKDAKASGLASCIRASDTNDLGLPWHCAVIEWQQRGGELVASSLESLLRI